MHKIRTLGLTTALLLALTGVFVPQLVLAGKGFYPLDSSVRTGMLVSATKNTGVVEPASINNASSLIGVVGDSETDITVENGQVNVQTDGVVPALVSTVNGDIKVGDRISPSLLVGLGAKNQNSGWVVGTAQGSLSQNTKNAVKSTVSDTSGQKHEVYVATIPVLVDVMYFNTDQQNQQKTIPIPTKIQDIADSLAGRRASQVAIVLSFIVLLSGFAVTGIIVNAAVRNGIKSIARQPLAKQAITKQMVRSFLVAIGILSTSVVSALILLRII